MKSIVKNKESSDSLRRRLLERLQQANKMITEVVIEAAQHEGIRREVLLRATSALAHLQNVIVGICAVAGIPEADVARAHRLAKTTAQASIAHAQKKGEEGPTP